VRRHLRRVLIAGWGPGAVPGAAAGPESVIMTAGGRVLRGPDRRGHFVQPTIFAGVDNERPGPRSCTTRTPAGKSGTGEHIGGGDRRARRSAASDDSCWPVTAASCN